MSKVKCIIVEDEPLATKVITDYISQVPFLELQGAFKDAILATDWLREHHDRDTRADNQGVHQRIGNDRSAFTAR